MNCWRGETAVENGKMQRNNSETNANTALKIFFCMHMFDRESRKRRDTNKKYTRQNFW